MKRVIIALTWDIGFGALIAAAMSGIIGALHVLTFYIAIFFVIHGLYAAFCHEDNGKIKLKCSALGKKWPVIYDVLVSTVLVFFGHFILGTIYLITLALAYHNTEYVENQRL